MACRIPAAAAGGIQRIEMNAAEPPPEPIPASNGNRDRWTCTHVPKGLTARKFVEFLRKNVAAVLWDWRYLPAHDRAEAQEFITRDKK